MLFGVWSKNMLITLIWQFHRVYMNWHMMWYTLNTYNYHVSIKKLNGYKQLVIILHGKKSSGGMAPGRISSVVSPRTRVPPSSLCRPYLGVSFLCGSRWSQHFQTPDTISSFAGSTGWIEFSSYTSIFGKRMVAHSLHSVLERGHFPRRVGKCTHYVLLWGVDNGVWWVHYRVQGQSWFFRPVLGMAQQWNVF